MAQPILPTNPPDSYGSCELVNGAMTPAEKINSGTQEVESPFRSPGRENAMSAPTLVLALLIANVTNVVCLIVYL
jgi:hypothetical protein